MILKSVKSFLLNFFILIIKGITNDAHLIKKCRKILDLISGNDKIEMLKNILNKHEKEQLMDERYKNALSRFGELSNQAKTKFKHTFVRPMRLAKFTLNKTKTLNFKIGQRLWKTSLDVTKRHPGTLKIF